MNALSSYKAAFIAPRMNIGYSFMSVGLGFLFILLYSFFPNGKNQSSLWSILFFSGTYPCD